MPDARDPADGFGTRLIGRLLDPTLLSLPIVAVAFVVLRSHHLIAQVPLWFLGALLGGGFVHHVDVGAEQRRDHCALVNRAGHNLGLRVVAEGIETDEVAAALRFLGCEIGQGYWLSRPLDPATMGTWLRAHIREYGSPDAAVMPVQVAAARPGHLRALPGATA